MFEQKRRSALGQFGEAVVFDHLVQDGYNCTRLGGYHRCFDILAASAAAAITSELGSSPFFFAKKKAPDIVDRGSPRRQPRVADAGLLKNPIFAI